MNDLNTILLEGKLVRDPELAYTTKEQAYCTFSIAVNRYYKQEEEFKNEASYFDVVIWGKTAETCGITLKKGRGVRVCGRLKQERWTDESGNINKKIRIIADFVEFKPEPKNKSDLSNAVNTESNAYFTTDSSANTVIQPELIQEEDEIRLTGSRH